MHVSTAEWIAIGAAAAAVLTAAFAFAAWWKLRAVRTAQLVLLGGGKHDLVDFAVSLQARIDDLHRAVDEIAAGLSREDGCGTRCQRPAGCRRYENAGAKNASGLPPKKFGGTT